MRMGEGYMLTWNEIKTRGYLPIQRGVRESDHSSCVNKMDVKGRKGALDIRASDGGEDVMGNRNQRGVKKCDRIRRVIPS